MQSRAIIFTIVQLSCVILSYHLVATAPPKKGVKFDLKNVEKEKIVPEIIEKCPSKVLRVDYPTGASAQLGNYVRSSQAAKEPKFSYEADQNQLYTILIIDPDAPSREEPKLRNVIHYIKNNIPGNKTQEGDLAVEYVQPCPFPKTGKHRIIFLLYKQKDNERVESEETVASNQLRGRGPLDLQLYAKENNLGQPEAINFQLSDFDLSVQSAATKFG